MSDRTKVRFKEMFRVKIGVGVGVTDRGSVRGREAERVEIV